MLLPNGVLPGVVYVESEFQVPGAWATCGPNSLAMAESYGAQAYVSTSAVYARMRSSGRADAGGASNMSGIQAQAQADGFRVARFPGGDWKAWTIARLREGAPVVLEPSKGQVLVDLVTGQHMDATNLQYHFNLAVGYWPGGGGKPEGFWMADGDNGATNPVVNGKRTRVVNGRNVQFYSAANLAASAPVALMAVYPKVSIQPPAPPAHQPASFPAGWSDDGTTLTYGGVPVVKGFRVYLLAHPELVSGTNTDNTPLGPEEARVQVELNNTSLGSGSVQTFNKMRLVWTPSRGVFVSWIGATLVWHERQSA